MTKLQWTLAGLLVVQAMLIAVLRHQDPVATHGPKALVEGLDVAAVARIEVGTKPDERLVVEKNGTDWKIATAGGYPADAAKVDELLEKIGKAETRGAVVTSDKYHESLEVTEEKAQARIRLYAAGSDKPLADLILGKTSSGGAHVRRAGDENVYDVRDLSPWQLRPDTATWMQRRLVDVPTESVQRLAVRNANGSFELERKDGDWVVALPEESKGRSCTKDKVETMVRSLGSLSAANPGGVLDPATQGLGDDAVIATITHDEGTTTIRIGAAVPDKDGQLYVTTDGFGFAATQWETSLSSVVNAKLEELLP